MRLSMVFHGFPVGEQKIQATSNQITPKSSPETVQSDAAGNVVVIVWKNGLQMPNEGVLEGGEPAPTQKKPSKPGPATRVSQYS